MIVVCRHVALITMTLALATAISAAAEIGELDDFQAGVEGWIHPITNPFIPVVVEDGGPAGVGDDALQIRASGRGRQGSRLVAVNESQWLGSFADIATVQAHVLNTSDRPLTLRLGFNGPDGSTDRFVTAGVDLEANSDWTTASFPVTPESLQEAGGSDPVAALNEVTQLRILHNQSQSFLGARVEASFLVDNIISLPAGLIAGDADLDGDVDSADRTVLTTNWTGAIDGFAGKTVLQGDADGDGDVDSADQTFLSANWTGAMMASQGTMTVPEPSTVLLAFSGLLWFRCIRRRR